MICRRERMLLGDWRSNKNQFSKETRTRATATKFVTILLRISYLIVFF